MDIVHDWEKIKAVFEMSSKTSFHHAIASVNEDGTPHITPIGSLLLTEPGRGVYFEKYTHILPDNLNTNPQVCILAVNSSRWFWIKSLLLGRFVDYPALRLYGHAGALREATDDELKRWQSIIKDVKFTRGYRLMWKDMTMVREITFTKVEVVKIGEMTKGLTNV